MNSPYWFEVAVIFAITTVGNIYFGHFEVETPKWRRALKAFLAAGLAVTVSATAGRPWFFVVLGLMFILLLVVHGWWLPRLGINGWTAEPRDKYYALRGWRLR